MSEFMWGWLLGMAFWGLFFYFDSKKWWRKHRELEAANKAVSDRIDALLKG